MLKAATTLEEAYKTLSPEPVLTEAELEVFYSDHLNEVRGGDRVARLNTPVFDVDHAKHRNGRSALRSILESRVDRRLFTAGVVDRLVVASGGNVRDLLFLAREAVEEAILAGKQKVGKPHAVAVVDRLRLEYTRRLGESPYDKEKIPYQDKAKRLVEIYENKPDANIPDAVLYSLFLSRAVQEFNSEGWIGVHPLVVDILKSQQRLPADAAGGTG